MKKMIVLLMTLTMGQAFAYKLTKNNITIARGYFTTETAAEESGLAVEEQIKSGQYVATQRDLRDCYTKSWRARKQISFSTKSFKIEKEFINAKPVYKTLISAVVTCPEEYDVD